MVLRWPVKGRIISGFGKRADGSHNDGVDVAVPFGTDVLAAEDGVVAYAGNEVKTYGNLVLVRHDNGWVTAYAYNDKVLVQRGDRVKRGQPIAKAGKSGAVDQPQVHFELRQGSKPVDPMQADLLAELDELFARAAAQGDAAVTALAARAAEFVVKGARVEAEEVAEWPR